jgi:hypothetical protein
VFIAGIYPLIYYYDKNYALINSPSQLLFFLSFYLFIPATLSFLLVFGLKKITKGKKYAKYLLPMFNLVVFFMLVTITLFGHDAFKITLALFLGLVFGRILSAHLVKVITIQLILCVLVLPKLIPDLYRELVYSRDWMVQQDSIAEVKFRIKPNIYLIQPDGYTNFSDLNSRLYQIKNDRFEDYLDSKGFVDYDDYRSNYATTLSSNSALFGMGHHYYGNRTFGINPSHNKRNEIVGDNPVLDILKKNNYKTFLLLDVPYLLANRPKVDFDYSNISLDEISFISRGFSLQKNLLEDTKKAILSNKTTPNFFFIEAMQPGHIATWKSNSGGIEKEAELYAQRLKNANDWLIELIEFIETEDPNSLIIIAADHGGYVGFEYMKQCEIKEDNPLLIASIFSSALAIKWPNSNNGLYDRDLKSSVNLFRTVFSYLSDNQNYLKNLSEDKSYVIINQGAPEGVYEYIDETGEIVFNKVP